MISCFITRRYNYKKLKNKPKEYNRKKVAYTENRPKVFIVN